MIEDLDKILTIAGRMQTEMPALKEKLAATDFTAEAGGGAVSATVNGKLAIVNLKIAEQIRNDPTTDYDLLETLIKAAISAAQAQAADAAAKAMKELTGGMDIAEG
ncbi:Nucleoid-associated protein [Thiorhodovibrio litoralis]|nr:hypothetical protein [Thiorhodovibrio winogradskyi]WPL14358.1 Nucleoid-associated protein [Thiorhodovibrio litoralis]